MYLAVSADVKANTHFLCGPFNEKVDLDATFKEFALREEVINSFGVPTHNPVEFYRAMGADGLFISQFFNVLVAHMVMCPKVITLHDWETCPVAKKIIEIAHILGKEVISYDAFVLKNTKNEQ